MCACARVSLCVRVRACVYVSLCVSVQAVGASVGSGAPWLRERHRRAEGLRLRTHTNTQTHNKRVGQPETKRTQKRSGEPPGIGVLTTTTRPPARTPPGRTRRAATARARRRSRSCENTQMGATGFRARWAAGGCGAAIMLQRALDTYMHVCTHVCMETSNIRIRSPSALYLSIFLSVVTRTSGARRAPQRNMLAVLARLGDETTAKRSADLKRQNK